MSTQICNNCGRTISMLEKGHLFQGKVVCGACIKILAPPEPERKKAVIIGQTRDRSAESTKAKEDARYERAKRRCVFFFSSVIWVVQLLLFFLFLAMIPMIVVLVRAMGWLFR